MGETRLLSENGISCASKIGVDEFVPGPTPRNLEAFADCGKDRFSRFSLGSIRILYFQ
jgi:hypothetical protein